MTVNIYQILILIVLLCPVLFLIKSSIFDLFDFNF